LSACLGIERRRCAEHRSKDAWAQNDIVSEWSSASNAEGRADVGAKAGVLRKTDVEKPWTANEAVEEDAGHEPSRGMLRIEYERWIGW
jgi:hypothetical protein